jgi:hypothetical protein
LTSPILIFSRKAFQFEGQPRKKPGNCNALIFSRQLSLSHIAPEKNREKFDILQSHNLLSERRLQKTIESSIYNNADFGQGAFQFLGGELSYAQASASH